MLRSTSRSLARALGAALTLATLVAAGPRTVAAQVTVGTARDGSALCLPFGCDRDQTRYQQVYSATAFAAPLTIGSLTFYHTQSEPGAGQFTDLVFDVYFSTTTTKLNKLGTDFDANLGTPAQLFAHATLTGSATAPSFTFVGNPFAYDPSMGNLVLDFRISSVSSNTPFSTFFDADYTGAKMRSISDYSFGPGTEQTSVDREALVTTFGPPTTTPEPATLALCATGLAALAGFARRRRSVRA